MNTIIPIQYIERKPNSEQYRIVGKGITVTFLACFIDDPEWTVERISEEYNLTPAEIYAVWSFYYDHKAEIDGLLERQAQRNAMIDSDEEKRQLPLYQRYLEIQSKQS